MPAASNPPPEEPPMSAIPKSIQPPVRERVSKEEWQMRVDLAAAYQLAHLYRWTDMIYTHFSARVPGTEDFLINPYGLLFDEINASNLVKIDWEGQVLDDPLGMGVNQAGFVIHSCVHKARPEVSCVIHTHTRAGVAVSAMKCGLLPISQHAMRVQAEVTYHDYEGIALYMEEQERLARDLGKASKAMILRNHGLLTWGPSVSEAFMMMWTLQRACDVQIAASRAGAIQPIRPEVFPQTVRESGPAEKRTCDDAFAAWQRKLDAIDPSYRD